MPRMQADTPFTEWNKTHPRKPREPHKHDSLCITSEPWSNHGLFCWCKCAQCWDPLMRRCICSACHCYRARAAS